MTAFPAISSQMFGISVFDAQFCMQMFEYGQVYGNELYADLRNPDGVDAPKDQES